MNVGQASQLMLVLHAHLPFVRHPEHPYHLEENWLYEAITDTYLPLLRSFQLLASQDAPLRLCMSLSPTLCSMLADELLMGRYRVYLERLLRLGEEEVSRREGPMQELARFYLTRFTGLRDLFLSLGGDVLGAYGQLQEAGLLELMTVAATHAYLPVVRERSAKRAQLSVAVQHYRDTFGRYPRGMWLPECGYHEGLDQLLQELGLRYFFMDAHGLLHGRPRPPLGLLAPVYTPAGVAAFGRDPDSSKQVWSASEGYPGDGVYRDFYRDIGFDLPLCDVGPYVHPDGIRVHTGYKYHRVTGPGVELADKALYEPLVAAERARVHAAHFADSRRHQGAALAPQLDRPPLLVCPYDAELFGHWWFEGPSFLQELVRLVGQPGSGLRLITPSEYLQEHPQNAVCEPAPSSWGDGGYSAVWLDQSNDWLYRHVHQAEAQMAELCQAYAGRRPEELERRALCQMARELLLAQSSDWAFIMKTGTAVRYAVDRVKCHLARFHRLARELQAGTLGESAAWLADVEGRDNLFPQLDYRVYVD